MSEFIPSACSHCQRSLIRIGQGGNRVNVCPVCDASQCPEGHSVLDATARTCPTVGCRALLQAHIPRDPE